MKSELVKRVSGIVLGVATLVLLLSACNGSGAKASPTSTAQKAVATSTPTSASAVATPTTVKVATPTTAPTGSTPTPSSSSTGATGQVIQVKLNESPYSFDPKDYSFQVGKTYTLKFSTPAEFHTFTVADLGIDIYIDIGKSVQQVVTVSKTGTFRLICSVHEELDMVGSVTVR